MVWVIKWLVRLIGKALGKVSKLAKKVSQSANFRSLRNQIIKWAIISREEGQITIGKNVHFEKNIRIYVDRESKLAIKDNCVIRDYTDIRVVGGGTVVVGEASVLGIRCLIRCRKLIEIGDCVSIGPDCKIIDHVHSLNLRGKTPDKYWTKPIKISNGVGLFSNVFVSMGAEIGEYSKVSLNSVVKGRVPPSHLVGGDPLKTMFPRN